MKRNTPKVYHMEKDAVYDHDRMCEKRFHRTCEAIIRLGSKYHAILTC